MFHALFSLIGMGIALAAALAGYAVARQFTENKLRFVDAVHKASAPILAGLGAMVIAAPVVAILPLVGAGTAFLFGTGVALGVNAGARSIRKRIGAG
jgi:hypothetical protein